MPYDDQSPMPFGKYKDRPLEKVPAQYLLWLWDEGIHNDVSDSPVSNPKGLLANYIKKNFSALETEASDYLVIHRP